MNYFVTFVLCSFDFCSIKIENEHENSNVLLLATIPISARCFLGFKKSNGLKKEEIYFFSISKKSRGVTIMGVDGKCFIFPVTRCVSVVFPWARATE